MNCDMDDLFFKVTEAIVDRSLDVFEQFFNVLSYINTQCNYLYRERYIDDRNKLLIEAQQLSVDLEAAREQVALRNRDHVQNQETLLRLESQVRELGSLVRQRDEELNAEKSNRTTMEHR